MMRATLLALLLLSAAATTALAATLGLLPCTANAGEHAIAKAKGAARVVVARTAAEWAVAWRAAGGAGKAPRVDFAREMVVGVVSAAKATHVIYRIQLDSGLAPTALEVHASEGGAPCGPGARTPAATGAHFVVTPRSALPVRFVLDEMIDGRMFVADPDGEGVGTTELGAVPAGGATGPGKAANREDAERAVVAGLTAAEQERLAIGPLDRRMKRLPHGWTRLEVTRERGRWRVRYEDLAFEVDVATGTVTRR
jgi:hypothetical protein